MPEQYTLSVCRCLYRKPAFDSSERARDAVRSERTALGGCAALCEPEQDATGGVRVREGSVTTCEPEARSCGHGSCSHHTLPPATIGHVAYDIRSVAIHGDAAMVEVCVVGQDHPPRHCRTHLPSNIAPPGRTKKVER